MRVCVYVCTHRFSLLLIDNNTFLFTKYYRSSVPGIPSNNLP